MAGVLDLKQRKRVVRDEAGETGHRKTTETLISHVVDFYFILEAMRNH